MKLAFSKPTRTDEERQQLFAQFHVAGYDGLQLKSNQYLDAIKRPTEFVECSKRLPGVASALIIGSELDPPGIALLRDAFRFAKAVGTERIVFCHVRSRDDVTDNDIREFARMLSELGQEAREQGTKVSLHHHYGQPVMHRRDFDTFFNATDPGSVGLTIDTAHAVKSGIADIASLIYDFREVIDNFHLKDYANGDWRVLGQGDIDFEPIFAAIRAIGYDGWLSADEESGSDLADAMEECHRYIDARTGLNTSGSNLGNRDTNVWTS